ncbi:MAG: helix-turn-helix domain-containing protein [Polyangiaceae bacterium]
MRRGVTHKPTAVARRRSAPPAPKGRAREARRTSYYSLLLEVAERVFADRGYVGTRMQDIATEAGLALATVYSAVAGKEELYAAIHETRGRALLERAASAASESARAGAFEALIAGIETYVDYLTEHPNYLRLHLNEGQPWALDPKFICDEQRRQWREGLGLVTNVFRASIAEGSVIEMDPEVMARLTIAAHQVMLVHWVENHMREPSRDLVTRMKDHVRRSFGARRE